MINDYYRHYIIYHVIITAICMEIINYVDITTHCLTLSHKFILFDKRIRISVRNATINRFILAPKTITHVCRYHLKLFHDGELWWRRTYKQLFNCIDDHRYIRFSINYEMFVPEFLEDKCASVLHAYCMMIYISNA